MNKDFHFRPPLFDTSYLDDNLEQFRKALLKVCPPERMIADMRTLPPKMQDKLRKQFPVIAELEKQYPPQ